MMRETTVCGLGAALLFAMPVLADGTNQYNNRAAFEAALGTFIVDDYQAAGYLMGDVSDGGTLDIHTDAHMSSILSEADYMSTGFSNWNFVVGPEGGDKDYCAGCNGSFQLGFLTTSVGTPLGNGVYGAGFDIENNNSYHAFITFGNGDTLDVVLSTQASFWGITSKLDIQSIHVGLINGGSTTGGYFEMDNLTIGNVPAPGVLVMLGLAGLAHRRRRRR